MAQVLTEVWVFYDAGSGVVRKVSYVKPDGPLEEKDSSVLKTSLSEYAILNVHRLRVRRGRVTLTPSTGGP